MKQVNSEHYNFGSYLTSKRWMSYYYQILEILKRNPKNILIIGKGDDIVPYILKKLCQNFTKIDTFDFDEALEPDIIGDIRNLSSILKSKYDCIVCCQVLEHLPFDNFEKILKEMKAVLKPGGGIILSLPQRSGRIKFLLEVHKTALIKFCTQIPLFRKYRFNGQHYWEMRAVGTSKRKILDIVHRNFNILDNYTVFENPYHFFIICESK